MVLVVATGLISFLPEQHLLRESLRVPPVDGDINIQYVHDAILGDIECKWPALKNFATKLVLDLRKCPNARYLDGTPDAYYYSPEHLVKGNGNGMRKFFMFKAAGSWCLNDQDSLARSQSELGSSSEEHSWSPNKDILDDGERMRNMGFSSYEHLNPMLFNWNHIYVLY